MLQNSKPKNSTARTLTPYRDDKALVDINDPAELITCLLVSNARDQINIDVMYAELVWYFGSVDQVSMDGLNATIKMAIRKGYDHDSNQILPKDVFN